jgi:hypothetical protein
MKRREFFKSGLLVVAGAVVGTVGASQEGVAKIPQVYELEKIRNSLSEAGMADHDKYFAELINTNTHLDLSPDQHKVLTSILDGNHTMVVASSGWGKTFMAAAAALELVQANPNYRVGVFCPSFRQSGYILDEIQKQTSKWKKAPSINSNNSMWFVMLPNGSQIRSFPVTDGSRLKGARFHTVIIDEAASLPEDVFNMCIRPTLATQAGEIIPSGRIVMFTQAGYQNWVYTLYRKYQIAERVQPFGGYKAFNFPWNSVPKGFIDLEMLNSAQHDMPEDLFDMTYEARWIRPGGVRYYANPQPYLPTNIEVSDLWKPKKE